LYALLDIWINQMDLGGLIVYMMLMNIQVKILKLFK